MSNSGSIVEDKLTEAKKKFEKKKAKAERGQAIKK
jgi:hypothetical protein